MLFDTTCCSAVISDIEDVTCNQDNPEHKDMPHGTGNVHYLTTGACSMCTAHLRTIR